MRYCLVAFNNFTRDLICYKTDQIIHESHLGHRVIVPFGKKKCIGVVCALTDTTTLAPDNIKSVCSILDPHPLLSQQTLGFIQAVANYYHIRFNQLICQIIHRDLLTDKTHLDAPWLISGIGAETPSGQKIQGQCMSPRYYWDIVQNTTCKQVDHLISQDALISAEPHTPDIHPKLVTLSDSQQQVYTKISKSKPQTHLLWGITGSGKTEVYTHLITDVLKQQKQVLVLVPEIALTTQTADKIAMRTGASLMVIHSGLTPKQRLARWLCVKSGAVQIILGTRSALFCDFKALGLIIVDEEHDDSYRSQGELFFSARDMAVLRAHQCGIPIVLGSATPSLESLHNANSKRYQLHKLHKRRHTQLPKIYTVLHKGKELLHPEVTIAFEKALVDKHHVLVFISRRGWSNIRYCIQCQWQARCPSCSGLLVAHQDNTLHCHSCRTIHPMPLDCPSCEQTELVQHGFGSQQVSHMLSEHFPKHNVLRFDTDQTPSTLSAQFKEVHKTHSAILVGTQMLTKGHDIASVQMVVVVQADQGLYSHDFRAEENMFAELMQVAGRCGRREKQGQVWIQTQNPDHPVFQSLTADIESFPAYLLDRRKQYMLPPFCYQAVIFIRLKDIDIKQLNHLNMNVSGADLLGPIPHPRGNLNQMSCYYWLINASSRDSRRTGLNTFLPTLFAKAKRNWKIWWQIDSHFCP